jgi:hypothetical protein
LDSIVVQVASIEATINNESKITESKKENYWQIDFREKRLLLKSNKFDHKKNDLFEVRKFS